jgi:pilus assembly protein Flp/PilA
VKVEGTMTALLWRFVHSQDGATAIEYGLIAALIAVALIGAFTVFGQSLFGLFGHVRDTAGNAMDAAGV